MLSRTVSYKTHFQRLSSGMAILAVGWLMLGFLLLALAWPVYALPGAQPSGSAYTGVITYDVVDDFRAVCAALPDILPAPQQMQISISPAAGGELRLRPTLEDYFEGPQLDVSTWISGYSNPAYPTVASPQIVDGVLRLDANHVRAQQPFGGEMPVRFFEARARFVTAPYPVAYADLGFYRSLPPLRAVTETSSIRLFVAQTTIESATPRHLFVRSKDGLFKPSAPAAEGAIDTVVDNWGGASAAQMAGMNEFRTYAIYWDQNATQYLIDGSTIITAGEGSSQPLPHPGLSTLPTYVLLYSQDPSGFDGGRSPLLVDWVRAGAYPAQGRYTSCVLDAGAIVNWSRVAISTTIPPESAIIVESRTSQDGAVWSEWSAKPIASAGATQLKLSNPGGRYFQYRLTLNATNPMYSPEVASFEVAYSGPKALRVNPAMAYVSPNQQVAFDADVIDGNDEVILGHRVPIQWSVINGGGAIDGAGLFTAGANSGRFTNTVQAQTPGLLASAATVNVGYAPAVSVELCCQGREGVPITLTAASDAAAHGAPLVFEWDVDGDGMFGDLTGETVTHVFPKTGQYPVKVLVTGSLGFTNTALATAVIENVPPQIVVITATDPVTPRQPVTITVTAVDVPAAILTYSFDWDQDGVFDVVEQAANVATTGFETPGTYIVGVRVRDDDGASSSGTVTVRVNPYSLYLPAVVR